MIYSTKTLIMAVMGDPIDHSLSPFMHGAVIEEHGFDALYIPVRVAPDETARFAEAAA
jgi:shikimate 5-dehydrogenase